MKNKFFDHFDLWLKMILHHFDKHKWQGRIFFTGVAVAIVIWSTIVAFYAGEAIKDSIELLTKCK